MPGFQFSAYKLHVPRQIEILCSALMTLFCEKWPYFITFFFQTGYLVLVALSLIARTYCDVWMIHNGTAIER